MLTGDDDNAVSISDHKITGPHQDTADCRRPVDGRGLDPSRTRPAALVLGIYRDFLDN